MQRLISRLPQRLLIAGQACFIPPPFLVDERLSLWALDNIFCLRSWAVNKFNVDRNDFDKNFGIPAEFDYVDFK